VSDAVYRCSFDAVAETYESGRPPYAEDAVAWIAERLPFERVLDLAAGTGKLTRQLLEVGADVVAVEPGAGMRAVLARELPEVETLEGTAESIPLPDASVDAVTVGQAFHWFRTEKALREMHRVLRPGGGFALLWNVWGGGDPLLQSVDELVRSLTDGAPPSGWRSDSPAGLFGELEERAFHRIRLLATDALVQWVASTSRVSTASPETRSTIESGVRALAGGKEVEVSIATEVVAADRV